MSKTQQATELDPVAAGTEGHATSAPEPKGWSKYFVSRTKLIQIWTSWFIALAMVSGIPWFFSEFDGPYQVEGEFPKTPLKRKEGAVFITETGDMDIRCSSSFYPNPFASCRNAATIGKKISIEYYKYRLFSLNFLIGRGASYEGREIFNLGDVKNNMMIHTIIEASIIFAIFAFYASTKRN
jgi:hypothetical protein